MSDGSYQSRVRDVLIRAGLRSILAVPLLREGRLLGALAVNRNEPGAFAPEVVALLKTLHQRPRSRRGPAADRAGAVAQAGTMCSCRHFLLFAWPSKKMKLACLPDGCVKTPPQWSMSQFSP